MHNNNTMRAAIGHSESGSMEETGSRIGQVRVLLAVHNESITASFHVNTSGNYKVVTYSQRSV